MERVPGEQSDRVVRQIDKFEDDHVLIDGIWISVPLLLWIHFVLIHSPISVRVEEFALMPKDFTVLQRKLGGRDGVNYPVDRSPSGQ